MNKNDVSKGAHLTSLAFALRRLAQLSQTHSWRLSTSWRLSPTQQRTLDLLSRRREGLSVSMLARELGVMPATASDCVNTLKSKGLAVKQPTPIDRRIVLVSLTHEGLAKAESLACRPDPFRAGLESLSEEEQMYLYRSLIKVINNLERSGELSLSRMCVRCRWFDPARRIESPTPHHCQSHDVPLAELDMKMDCTDFEVTDESSQDERLRRFESMVSMLDRKC